MNLLFSNQEIKQAIEKIANEINNKKHDEPPIFICVLNGAFMFFTDLVKQIEECEIDFIRIKTYPYSLDTDKLVITADITSYISNRDVYIVDDIYDSGNTIEHILFYLSKRNPKSSTPITLFKRYTSEKDSLIYGINLKNESYIVGYGLDDLKGLRRNLTYVIGLEDDNN